MKIRKYTNTFCSTVCMYSIFTIQNLYNNANQNYKFLNIEQMVSNDIVLAL